MMGMMRMRGADGGGDSSLRIVNIGGMPVRRRMEAASILANLWRTPLSVCVPVGDRTRCRWMMVTAIWVPSRTTVGQRRMKRGPWTYSTRTRLGTAEG